MKLNDTWLFSNNTTFSDLNYFKRDLEVNKLIISLTSFHIHMNYEVIYLKLLEDNAFN